MKTVRLLNSLKLEANLNLKVPQNTKIYVTELKNLGKNYFDQNCAGT